MPIGELDAVEVEVGERGVLHAARQTEGLGCDVAASLNHGRLVGHGRGIALRVVSQAEFDRIDASGVGQLVHRRLDGEHAGERAGCAHVAGRRRVELGQSVGERDVLAAVQHARPVHQDLLIVLVMRGALHGVVLDGLERAVRPGAEVDLLQRLRPVIE